MSRDIEVGAEADVSGVALSQQNDPEAVSFELLLEGIKRRWGYDFTHYSRASLKRRLDQARRDAGYERYTELLDRLLHDDAFFDHFLKYMSITVTEMFRDPAFYRVVRERVVPILKTFPFVKIWHAGCATGEEVYSLAIILHEEGFLDRATIYATDFNKQSLDVAQRGVYPVAHLDQHAANYRSSGGTRPFSDYFSSAYGLAKIKNVLKERVTFSYHNLVTDGVFGEMNVIFCRNVLIYFDKTLQNRAFELFTNSLRHGGFLCLGTKETLNFSSVKRHYEQIEGRCKIFKKCGTGDV
ncbi:MAG: protein-glutamate O-methyltransferase CheR [Alphaproteobacteria bacterium]|nr:protein-glutamate O-methyltransferase CheR [Alphaproteobacteria bacterium]